MMKVKYPISLASYSFHGMLAEKRADVFTYLEMLKYRYNVAYADIWTGFLPSLDPDFLKKVRASMDLKGARLANLCVDGPHLWVDDEDRRMAHKKQMLEYIAAAYLLGAKTVRVDFGGTDGYTMSEEAFEEAIFEQGKKDYALGKTGETSECRRLMLSYLSVVAPDRNKIITSALKGIPFNMRSAKLGFSEFFNAKGEIVAGYSPTSGWCTVATKSEMARTSQFWRVYMKPANKSQDLK